MNSKSHKRRKQVKTKTKLIICSFSTKFIFSNVLVFFTSKEFSRKGLC